MISTLLGVGTISLGILLIIYLLKLIWVGVDYTWYINELDVFYVASATLASVTIISYMLALIGIACKYLL